MSHAQLDLFQPDATLPEGLRYQPELISPADEARLLKAIAELPFRPFEFHGYLGKRRIVPFGWRYDYSARTVDQAAPIPDFLLPLRERVAAFAEIPAAELRQAMVTDYEAGAGIGWHRDKPMFGEVIGISLKSSCNLRFRRASGDGWERRSLNPAPRSAYLLQGPARSEWEHSIPGVKAQRYSVTFRRYLGD
ncbi:MAG TPA: alpha-ketoglutarate-dependent dioxygenase AlkB [Caulobacteraceae bacterium]|jgi:alkylated DNA repair dioxygenase AlkB